MGQDVARARLAGRHRVPDQGRAPAGPRRARLQPGRLRLHDLHRQFRPAPGRDFRCDQLQGAGRGVGAFRQPQLRGPRQSRDARELPRLAAAGGRLRARRHDAQEPHDGAHRHLGQGHAGDPQGHLAVVGGDRRPDPHHHQRGDVPHPLRRRLQGRPALAGDQGDRRRDLPLVRLLDLCAEPAVLRWDQDDARAGHRHHRRAHPRPVPRFDHHRPHLAGRLDQEGRPGRQLPRRASGAAGRFQLVRRAPRQPRGDDARHVRQHPHQEPDGAGRRRRRHQALSVGRRDPDLRRRDALPAPRGGRW